LILSGPRNRRPSSRKLAAQASKATKTNKATNSTSNTTSNSAQVEHSHDTEPIQIDSDHEDLAEDNTPKPNSSAKRPAVGSAGSPYKKTPRTNLSTPEAPERVQYQLIFKFWLDEESRSAQKLFSTGDNA
jgi:hypothetical protein